MEDTEGGVSKETGEDGDDVDGDGNLPVEAKTFTCFQTNGSFMLKEMHKSRGVGV